MIKKIDDKVPHASEYVAKAPNANMDVQRTIGRPSQIIKPMPAVPV